MDLSHSQLGKYSPYIDHYQPDLLFPIARKIKRDEISVPTPTPFYGYDLWNAYEISWLNPRGKPMIALGEITVPASSPYIIESKSFKLYLNSFNQTHFENLKAVENCMARDLSAAVQASVTVRLYAVDDAPHNHIGQLAGTCIDHHDVAIHNYSPSKEQLRTNHSTHSEISETLYSHLLKSNCLVTGQPDWGSIQITYTGPQIDHTSLLTYLIGFRQHNEFHEQCIERIFMDILRHCHPSALSVYARYTRRGGLDINPFRSSQHLFLIQNVRLVRQ